MGRCSLDIFYPISLPPTRFVLSSHSIGSDYSIFGADDNLIAASYLSQPYSFFPLAVELVLPVFRFPDKFVPHGLAKGNYGNFAFPPSSTFISGLSIFSNFEPRYKHGRPSHHPWHYHVVLLDVNLRLELHHVLQHNCKFSDSFSCFFYFSIRFTFSLSRGFRYYSPAKKFANRISDRHYGVLVIGLED